MHKLSNPWVNIPGYNCFGCAPNNSASVRMEFYEDGNEIISIWKPQPQFQGWLNTLHGGIQSVLLDEICAWIVVVKLGTTGVTSKMETRYKRPVSTNDDYILLRASIAEQRRNIVLIKAHIENMQGEICSEAVCTYFTFSKEKAADMKFAECRPSEQEISLEEAIHEQTEK